MLPRSSGYMFCPFSIHFHPPDFRLLGLLGFIPTEFHYMMRLDGFFAERIQDGGCVNPDSLHDDPRFSFFVIVECTKRREKVFSRHEIEVIVCPSHGTKGDAHQLL